MSDNRLRKQTREELVSYIRFQLEQLSSKNEHHRFEDMCQQFARLRICENLLPATGPVSAGGDQGRDFETYKTYLSTTPIVNSLFLAQVAEKPIVFACSLNKKLKEKIKSDLFIIFKESPLLAHIYYFSNQDIPVGKRHELITFTRDNYKTELTIFDGQALSESLANIDVFWIATEYLHVPSDMFPRELESHSIYQKYKTTWLTNNEIPQTHADFCQIQYGLREARYNKNERADLPNWIKKMECFLDKKFSQFLVRKAIYEIATAALRGLNNLLPQKKRVAQYFSDIESLSEISELEDAVCLLIYCSTAHHLKHCEFNKILFCTKKLY